MPIAKDKNVHINRLLATNVDLEGISDIENARLRRYRERLTGYNFELSWQEGKSNHIADALSRAPVFPPDETENEGFVDVCRAIKILQSKPDPILEPMIKASKADTDYQMIIEALGKIKTPKNLPINHPGRQLSSVWSELSVDNNLGLIILNGNRIVVPKSERKNLLQLIHASHCGTGKSNWRAKELYFWRGMNSEINALVHNCEICRPFLPS